MKITIDPKDYMGGRITVMGIAAILITWFHSGVIVPAGSLLELFKVTGDIGVDLFLFASGVGIYLAVNKYASYWQYLFRRVRRVLIPYLCVCVPLYYYEMRMFGGGYSLLLKRILMLDFWTACNLESWYIASILTLYLITPLLDQTLEKVQLAACGNLCSSTFLCGVSVGSALLCQLEGIPGANSRVPCGFDLWKTAAGKENRYGVCAFNGSCDCMRYAFGTGLHWPLTAGTSH